MKNILKFNRSSHAGCKAVRYSDDDDLAMMDGMVGIGRKDRGGPNA